MSNVIICLFAANGFDRAAQGVSGAGQRLAADNGGRLHAVVIGAADDALQTALSPLAETITSLAFSEYQPEACLNTLTQVCRELAAHAVLFGNDTYSQELAPRLAYRLGGSAVADGIELLPHGDKLRVKRAVYGGKAVATIELQRAPAVVWLRARAFEPAEPREGVNAEIKHVMPEAVPATTRIIERKNEAAGEARLEDAAIIVSGGRGLGGPEPFEDLKALAAILNAQVAASRAACDSGWCPPTWQVGQTGKKVAPGLYLAVAISGASQHLAGISDAKNIAAINTDADAPIFKHCRFGIVEDYKKVIPLLKEKLAAAKS
ncbi:MAG: electron transfer flavoprotein subunit alpha/FixB family protein [Acidobacteria bacterium]|nr:electron transfer flavoprotein subunit alpha/FixB family protein [Acidobacteriota bacterium]